jgi:nitrate reductase NapE component
MSPRRIPSMRKKRIVTMITMLMMVFVMTPILS